MRISLESSPLTQILTLTLLSILDCTLSCDKVASSQAARRRACLVMSMLMSWRTASEVAVCLSTWTMAISWSEAQQPVCITLRIKTYQHAKALCVWQPAFW